MKARSPEGRFPARRALILGIGGVMALAGGLAGWGVFASISSAVIASGRVAVESRNQVVEHIDGGTVSEVLAHTITTGYDDEEPHRIEVIVCMEADTIVIVVVDDSTAFDLSRAPASDIGSAIEDMDLTELGLFLVHQMMDSVEYQRVAGCNVVTMTKKMAEKVTRHASDEA